MALMSYGEQQPAITQRTQRGSDSMLMQLELTRGGELLGNRCRGLWDHACAERAGHRAD